MAPTVPERSWPRLDAGEAARLRALVLISILAAGLAWVRGPAVTAGQPAPLCPDGAVLVDGNVHCAPRPGTPLPGSSALWMGTPLDLNAASAQDLTVVRGLGPTLAARIVQDREALGPFPDIGSVIRVKGIGPKLSARIAQVAAVRDQGLSRQRSTPSAGSSDR